MGTKNSRRGRTNRGNTPRRNSPRRSSPRRNSPRRSSPRSSSSRRSRRSRRAEEETSLAAVNDVSKSGVDLVVHESRPHLIYGIFFVAGGIFALLLEHCVQYYMLKNGASYSNLFSDDI